MDFEKMRNISSCRTPITLRAYSKIFLHVIPIAFAPHFAHMMSNPPDESMPWPQFSGYFSACLYGMVFVCLDVVQDRLEQPFDQDGVDDVKLDVTDHYKPVLSMGTTNED